jgi:hypothetical protein
MACEGRLPRLDAAIFADTGWEPRRVYEHLDRLAAELERASIPLYRVNNGDLRRDSVDPAHRYVSIPYYTQREPGPCQRCGAAGEVPHEHDLWCNRCVDGSITRTDRCRRCRGTGQDDGRGIGRRQCTHEYKIAPIQRTVRELLGAPPPACRRVPVGMVAEQWIGFSADEELTRANRHKDVGGRRYLRVRYPLIELGMNRADCRDWLESRGWPGVAKSACIGCPFHTNAEWRHLRDRHPEEWEPAVAFDQAIRRGGARGSSLVGNAYLHRSRVPLDEAPIDPPTQRLSAGRREQIDADGDGELGGCSPYGCRSDPAGGGGP